MKGYMSDPNFYSGVFGEPYLSLLEMLVLECFYSERELLNCVFMEVKHDPKRGLSPANSQSKPGRAIKVSEPKASFSSSFNHSDRTN